MKKTFALIVSAIQMITVNVTFMSTDKINSSARYQDKLIYYMKLLKLTRLLRKMRVVTWNQLASLTEELSESLHSE